MILAKSMKIRSMLFLIGFLIFSGCIRANAKTHNNNLLIKNVTLIDGTTKAAMSEVDIEIINGRIAQIGPDLKSKASNTIDASGLFVTPGLIDCHTHLHSVPGAIYRSDSDQQIKEQQKVALKAYLAAGVTTILDAAAPESLFEEIKNFSTSNKAPRILGLAPFLTPKDGYFGSKESRGNQYDDLWKPVNDVNTVIESFKRASVLKPLGTKVTTEKGFGPFDTWPIFDEKIRKTIVQEAKKYQLPILYIV